MLLILGNDLYVLDLHVKLNSLLHVVVFRLDKFCKLVTNCLFGITILHVLVDKDFI